jgi:hypothetical protein
VENHLANYKLNNEDMADQDKDEQELEKEEDESEQDEPGKYAPFSVVDKKSNQNRQEDDENRRIRSERRGAVAHLGGRIADHEETGESLLGL